MIKTKNILIKDYFNSEIPERKIMTKKVSTYIAAFDCFDKTLIIFFASRGISFISFTNVIGIPVASGSFILCISFDNRNNKKLLKKARNKKKKSNYIVMLSRSKRH